MQKFSNNKKYLFIIFIHIFLLKKCSCSYSKSFSGIFLNEMGDEIEKEVTSVECVQKCKLKGYKYQFFHGISEHEKSTCFCFWTRPQVNTDGREEGILIKPEETPGDVNPQDIIVDGGFTEWTTWSTCSKTCKDGISERTRSCTNPTPTKRGFGCQGDTKLTESCNGATECPVHGKFTEWSTWLTCSVTCGGGTTSRNRSCTNPAPQLGGDDCQGDSSETEHCNTQVCPAPVDGKFTKWTQWTPCSATCGFGTTTRTRSCTNPAPQHGGKDCEGSPFEGLGCRKPDCVRAICGEIAGSYDGDDPYISRHQNSLYGEFRSSISRPSFTGSLGDDCVGTLDFPDDRKYKITFDKITCSVYFWAKDGLSIESAWLKVTNC